MPAPKPEAWKVRAGFAAWPALKEIARDAIAYFDPKHARTYFDDFAGAVR